MRFLFIVQGEGRGHLTQAISLAQILENNGHQVLGALIGSATGNTVQRFFEEEFSADIVPFCSPALVYSRKTKALSVSATVYRVFINFRKYLSGLYRIKSTVKEKQPDVIVNFYDALGGIHQFFLNKKTPMVCMAHQYLMLHHDFQHPTGHFLNRLLVNLNTRITALGAEKKLALSFYPGNSDAQSNIYLVPPLLRKEVKQLRTEAGSYFLAYVTQQSMAEEIRDWQMCNPEFTVHCFTDREQELDMEEDAPGLFFHKINGKKFLEMMSRCKGVISTAGFESVCEAMYLGKPVLMVPMKNHYEQTCNAIDAQNSGAGIFRREFVISDFTAFLKVYTPENNIFPDWESECSRLVLNQLQNLPETYSPFSLRPFHWLKFLQTR